ncbi:TVP38/TMEM64 family protein [Phycicoccus duodecadis]|uniref:TVP38/TMEM64 family membrane protein n=1 Tax=Phycicoccus duodecadis TaxID=173053 RepID=A0A2N3YJG4_9MICO|nr:TVP38/TMEM64 family protein [Phycicoccus duodecadis]PKW26993.1 putative membrane protein YdjX (TVP38/TMEM64 family) [Phycicoccus duodecadis]
MTGPEPPPVDGPAATRLRVVGALFTLLLVASVVVVVVGGDLEGVRAFVAGTGAWGPVTYIGVHVVLTLLPVPKNLLAGIAGALFGVAGGVVLGWVGAMLSAVVAFALARRLGQSAVAGLSGRRVVRVQRLLREQGLLTMLVARLTPFVPFTVVNYAAGVGPTSRRDYLVGTAVGILPGTVAYVVVGASAGRDTTTIALAGGAGVVLLLLTVLAGRRLRRGGPDREERGPR